MRRCTRCLASKPDACFTREESEDAAGWRRARLGWCLHCRTIKDQMGMETSPPEPPTPSPLGGLGGGLVTIFRRELASWEERGAPAIPRPYVYVKGRKMSGKSGALGTLSHGG